MDIKKSTTTKMTIKKAFIDGDVISTDEDGVIDLKLAIEHTFNGKQVDIVITEKVDEDVEE